MNNSLHIGFLGAGKMATALAKGWIQAGLANVEHILASDPVLASRESFTKGTGVSSVADNRQVVEASDVLILAVQPQNMAGLLNDIKLAISSRHLVVSIAAGIPLGQIAKHLGDKTRLIRVMPNTPCLVGAMLRVTVPDPPRLLTTFAWWIGCWAAWAGQYRFRKRCSTR